ncbi:hypothetical protein E2C01_003108 [Portunus trituberculatus]|uniref:Uncharacterized protein n=1 Tax=Portunus trituberculatus TaxID=210409 RepID=A0A5B7CNU9_PORTR|nr:hypothetical protein [Portunus trituberculatus]
MCPSTEEVDIGSGTSVSYIPQLTRAADMHSQTKRRQQDKANSTRQCKHLDSHPRLCFVVPTHSEKQRIKS